MEVHIKTMKQYITEKQLNELNDKAKERLRNWWKPKEGDFIYDLQQNEKDLVCGYGYYEDTKTFCCGTDPYEDNNGSHELNNTLPLLSIGQMVEFLNEHEGISKHGRIKNAVVVAEGTFIQWHGELCDFLWDKFKEVLDRA